MQPMKSASAERFAMLARGKKPYSHRQVAESIEANIESLRRAVDRRRMMDGQGAVMVQDFLTPGRS